ncbi:MAG TPA: SpoIIIAH-like family protein [Candidatus Merdisoma faecalis]|uniref:SpoIIIAH-like family protein n=1 Tax=Lachnoclostridium sp. An138 TaxID=1965560 RepID=UPI0013DE17C4|nr:SpoIIIAH-like family protein [Lachnoclostridium sp. An138]HIR97540.1 SpoIIIAH-like family protein [Candidatus Merdisoma faecalis]
MKNIFKKNQMIITALAIMIAVAGYLNYSGSRLDSAKVTTDADASAEEDAEAAADISAEDIYAETGLEELQFADGDIVSLDQDAEDLAAADAEASAETEGTETADAAADGTETADASGTETAEVDENEEPGEAVLANSSTAGVSIAAEAKLTREQLRSKNKETLLEVINNTNISDAQKQEAIDSMVELTDIAEREAAAEILLEAKGFEDVVVSITDDQADVVVNMTDVDEAGRAQIEDIVKRKTGISGENIIITPVAAQE